VPLVIDTYNVLHVTGVLPPELVVGDPAGLAELIARSRFAVEAAWLVCDGVPKGASRSGRVVIEGAGHGGSADDAIVAIVGRSSAPRRMTVVTSDRGLTRRVRSRGVEVLRSEEFLAMLVDDLSRVRGKRGAGKPRPASPRRSVPLSEREVAGWMEVFRISAELAAIEATETPAPAPRKRTVRSASTDAALERYLEATKELEDPLSVLEGRGGADLLDALGALDDASLEAMMAEHEPSIEKDGARVGGRKKPRKRSGKRGGS
jgi:hypothetical protein